MKKESKVRFISEVDTATGELKARKPFTVTRDNRRQFVRLEITSPMWLRQIKDIFGNFKPSDRTYEMEADILNISAGGVLVETDQPLNEGDIVAMRFRLQDAENLDNVLGLVKRADQDEGFYLAGIEFVTRSFLQDKLSAAELDLLSDRLGDFQQGVQQVLSRYLYTDEGTQHK